MNKHKDSLQIIADILLIVSAEHACARATAKIRDPRPISLQPTPYFLARMLVPKFVWSSDIFGSYGRPGGVGCRAQKLSQNAKTHARPTPPHSKKKFRNTHAR